MNWVDRWGVTLTVFLPTLGVALMMLTPRAKDGLIKGLALLASAAALLTSLLVMARFDSGDPGMQFELNVPWIPSIGANYHIGLDGIALPLFVLSAFMTFLCMVYSLWHLPEPYNPKAFLALCL